MNNTSHSHSLVVDIASEHRDLEQRLLELRRLVRSTDTAPAIAQALITVATSLTKLREQMRRHFAEEAAGGVIEEAVARLPRLASDAAMIEREHPELMRQIDEAIRLAEQAGPSTEEWENVRAAVEAFVARMLAHEAAENWLLQQGFNELFS